jgi:hypothetical protein
MAKESGFDSWQVEEILIITATSSTLGSGTNPALSSMYKVVFCPYVKRPRLQADLSFAISAQVKNACYTTS